MKDMNYDDTEEMTWLKRTGGYDSDKTLRDTIAMNVLNAMLTMPEMHQALEAELVTTRKICGAAYEWADLMLEVRGNV